MARGNIEVKKVDTVFDELDRLQQAIRERAYDMFRNGGTPWGSALRDWLTAERDLVAKPPIELRQRDNQFEVSNQVRRAAYTCLWLQLTADIRALGARVEELRERLILMGYADPVEQPNGFFH